MWHATFILLHALTGVISFVAGCVAIRRGRAFGLYLWSMAGMLAFLVLAIGVTWADLDSGTQVLFVAFVVLGGVMLWRSVQARGLLPVGPSGPSGPYFDHVGFTLVALFDAFMVIAVLDLGGPAWAIVGTGVVVAVIGHYVLKAVRARLVAEPATAAVGPGGDQASRTR